MYRQNDAGLQAELAAAVDVVGEELAGEFMWMFEVQLDSDVRLDAYKHIDTRRYVHLDPSGATYVYEPPDVTAGSLSPKRLRRCSRSHVIDTSNPDRTLEERAPAPSA